MTDSHDHAADAVAGTDRDSRPRSGAAPRRPSAGVVVVSGPACCNAAPLAADGRRLTPSCLTDRYRSESPPVLPVHGGPRPADARRRTSGAEPPVTGPLRNGVEWPWR